MGIFDWLFGKKGKDSEVKDVGKEKEKVKKKSRQIKTKESTEKKSTVKPNVGKLKEKKDVEGLIKSLRHKDEKIRAIAAHHIGQIEINKGNSRAVKPLIQALKDNYATTRYNAAEALCLIGDIRALEPLIQALSYEKDMTVRLAVERAVRRIERRKEKEETKITTKNKMKKVQCSYCGGKGKERAGMSFNTGEIIYRTCSVCKGTGSVEKEMQYFTEYPDLSLKNANELMRKHGKPIKINIAENHDVRVIFKDGTRYILGGFTVGYKGTGPEYTKRFLDAAGFDISIDEIAKMEPPVTLTGNQQQGGKDSEVKDVGKEKEEVKNKRQQITTKKSTKKKSTVKPTEGTRFVDNGDGTVTDNMTGLIWQKEDDGKERNYKEALGYCESLNLGGYDDWRLPRKEELIKLAESGYEDLKRVFPNIKAERYWAKTSHEELYWAENPDKIAYTVDFDPDSSNYGAAITYFRSYEYYIRAVRSG